MMTKRFSLFFLFVWCLLLEVYAQSSATFIPATDKGIVYVGRVSLSSGKYARYTYPGVQIRTVFTGRNIDMVMKPNSGYYMVELDGQSPYKVFCGKEDSLMVVAHDLRNGTHELTVTFLNEGVSLKPLFYGFLLDADASLVGKPTLPKHKIEFIGNSITCGLGIEAKDPKAPFSLEQQNHYITYEAITSRNLDAQCVVVARSGIGVYRNCLGNPKGTKGTMPDVYPYTTFGTSGERWDFSRYTPDVVCVGLGTNDTTNPSYFVNLLYQSFFNFYKTLRAHYPKTKIVFLTGTMLKSGSKRLTDLRSVLDRLQQDAAKSGDHEVYRLDFTPADGSLGYGTGYHPSARQHSQMAEELTSFLRKITGW